MRLNETTAQMLDTIEGTYTLAYVDTTGDTDTYPGDQDIVVTETSADRLTVGSVVVFSFNGRHYFDTDTVTSVSGGVAWFAQTGVTMAPDANVIILAD